ncbi:hypothetical protein [Halalkalibacter lacteus]|uniref:hypothetical protein n=1 Tax=Halalkalibacter lacteus TaxID=3090663 RepID=UPI002FCA4D19
MLKAIGLGVFFVILCVAIPSLLGYYHNDHEQSTDSSVQQTEKEPNFDQIIDEETTDSDKHDKTDVSLEKNNEENEDLVFTTTDEAMEAVLEHFSLTELISIYQSIRNGVDDESREELITMLQERFSDEEIEALKVIGFSELDKVLQ